MSSLQGHAPVLYAVPPDYYQQRHGRRPAPYSSPPSHGFSAQSPAFEPHETRRANTGMLLT